MSDVKVDLAAESQSGFEMGDGLLMVNVHAPEDCAGRHCVIHNPSDHHMREWKLNWRADRGLMERICPTHGTGHPDPDGLAYEISQGREYQGVHGCCGCC